MQKPHISHMNCKRLTVTDFYEGVKKIFSKMFSSCKSVFSRRDKSTGPHGEEKIIKQEEVAEVSISVKKERR